MTQQIVWVLFILVSLGLCYYILRLLFSNLYTPIFLFKSAQPEQIIESFVLFISFLLFIHAFLSDWMDVGFGKTQNDLYRAHKNAINNTLTWSLVFFLPYLYSPKAIEKTGYHIELIDLFLLSRVVFSIGYILGATIGHQSIRLLGFTVSIVSCLIMVGEVMGVSLIKYLK